MGTPATVTPPTTLPPDFDGWDKPGGAPPKTLPANFNGWDAPKASSRPAGLPAGVDLPDIPAHAPANMQAPAGSSLIPAALQAGETVKGIAKGAMHTGSSLLHAVNAPILPSLAKTDQVVPQLSDAADAMEAHSHPQNLAQKIGYGGEQVGEFFLPTGAEEGLAEHGGELMGRAGEFGGKLLGSGMHSGTVNAVQGGNFGTGAAAGVAGGAIGEGLRAAAPAIAETALRVRGNDRLFGRTVGDAILNDTSGVYPSSVASSAQNTINAIKPELEQRAADAGASGARGSLLPARQGLANTVNTHLMNRAVDSARELDPLASRLAVDPITHLPLAENQSPTGLLNLKRGINSDFIQNWRPEQPPGLRSSARGAYGAINDEFHRVVPGAQELDQRVSSLIPVTKRATAADANAGLLQRVAGRVSAHTGVLAGGALAGGGIGYHEGGAPGAVAGSLAGLIAPELLASPTAQMIMARGAHGAVPNIIIPAARAAALQLDRPKDNR